MTRGHRILAALCVGAGLLGLPGAAAAAPTGATLGRDVGALLDRTARQWAGMTTAGGMFANPFPADAARGHGAFVPPMLAYALHRAGQRTGDGRLIAAAERAWPRAVDPARASAFDLVGAAYAYRSVTLSEERRAQLADYLSRYGIPPTGHACLVVPTCYGNLRLVDALAVLTITAAGVRSADPAARLADPVLARTAALRVVDEQVPHVVDHGLRARVAGKRTRGSYLSDPLMNPLAYHALSAFALSEALEQLGPGASPAARRAQRETLDALAVLVAPDGDATWFGRGQAQVWVPAVVVAAMADGARGDPVRAGRYLAVARRALARLRRLHAGAQGLQLVPGSAARTTTDGIDGYAHAVAYNGLALFALTEALDALDAVPATPIGRLPSAHRLVVRDAGASGLAVVGNGKLWLAVSRKPRAVADLRFDSGALAIKRRTPRGWVDLLAPRPLAPLPPNTGGPALLRRGRIFPLSAFDIRARDRTITIDGGYRTARRWVWRGRFRWTLRRSGVRLAVRGERPGAVLRMLAYTPSGTGASGRRWLRAAGATWRFDRPIRAVRIRGYHSAPVEHLDAIEARFTVPRSGRVAVTIGPGT